MKALLLSLALSGVSIAAMAQAAGSYEAFKLIKDHELRNLKVEPSTENPTLGMRPIQRQVGRLPHGKFFVTSILNPDEAVGYYQVSSLDGIGEQKAILCGVSTAGVADDYPIAITNVLMVCGTRKINTRGGERTFIEIMPTNAPAARQRR